MKKLLLGLMLAMSIDITSATENTRPKTVQLIENDTVRGAPFQVLDSETGQITTRLEDIPAVINSAEHVIGVSLYFRKQIPLFSEFWDALNPSTLSLIDVSDSQSSPILCGRIRELLLIPDRQLSVLCLSYNYIDAEGMRVICEGLEDNATVTSLCLSRNNIDDGGVKHLRDALEKNKKLPLCVLDLSENGILQRGDNDIAGIIRAGKNLVELNLSGNGLWGRDDDIFGAVGESESLQTLILRNCGLTFSHISPLSGLYKLKTNRSLCRLDLSCNRMGSLKQLSEVLKVNTTLTDLFLSGCGIKGETFGDFGDLCKALKINEGLTRLDLSDNPLGDAGAKNLAEMLKVNKVLNHIDLSNCHIGDAGAIALAAAIALHPALVTIDLRGNPIGDAGKKALADAIDPDKQHSTDGLAPTVTNLWLD